MEENSSTKPYYQRPVLSLVTTVINLASELEIAFSIKPLQ